jgi:hypothetical protein
MVTLELGGKNAALFLDDLTPEAMVNGILEAGYLNREAHLGAGRMGNQPLSNLAAGAVDHVNHPVRNTHRFRRNIPPSLAVSRWG